MRHATIILLVLLQTHADAQSYSTHRIYNYGENYQDTVLRKDGTDSLFRLFEGSYVFAGLIRTKVFISASEVANLSTILSSQPIPTAVQSALDLKQNALGYTPYNATNPNGYISSITGANVTTALGYTPYNATNPNGYISVVPAQTFASITGKPTTLGGYGITDAYPLSGNPSSFLVAADITGKANLISPSFTTPNIGVALGTSLATTGNITSSGGSIGYVTGNGGTVSQNANKGTGVTLNKLSGEITLNNAALAAATIVSFTLTNSTISATDVLILNHVTTGTRGAYTLNAQCANGSAVIYVRNNTAGSLGEAIVIRYVVIKGTIN